MTERLPFHFSLSCIGEGNGNPVHCCCLENPRDGGAWWAAVYGVTQSQTRLPRLSSSSILFSMGFAGGSDGKESAYNAGDLGSIPRLGRSQGWEDPWEKEMATHTSIFAWRIPWPEEHRSWGCKELGAADNRHTRSSPQRLHQFTLPPRVQEGTLFSTTSPTFIVCRFFNDGKLFVRYREAT